MKVLDGSHERAMLAWANSWISDRLDRMSKQGDSPNYECGCCCGCVKGAQQLTFMYGCAAIRRHVRFTGKSRRPLGLMSPEPAALPAFELYYITPLCSLRQLHHRNCLLLHLQRRSCPGLLPERLHLPGPAHKPLRTVSERFPSVFLLQL